MSINFNAANAKLEATNSPFGTAFPFSIFCWIKPTNITTGMVAGVGDTTLSQDAAIYIETGKARPFQTGAAGNGGAATYSTQAVSATWQPVLVVFTSSTSRSVYYGSGAVVTGTGDTGVNSLAMSATWLRVGVRPSSGLIPYAGDIEDLAFWRAALTQADFNALLGGASPASITTGLLEHWPLVTQAATHVGAISGFVLTSSNTTQGTTSRPAGGIAAPAITTQPASQSVSAPATATFTVTASGSPTYQWQRSTDSGVAWSNITGATAASYTTPATTVSGGSANNGDQYRCIATNGQGSATSTAATLTVSVAAATATTMTGPTGGLVGAASAAFTVGANGSITGTVTVTLSDNAGGGTFSVASVAISSATPTATFTYTPASTGAKTISSTNSGALTNAASLTYTATVTVGTLTSSALKNNTGTLLASTACEAYLQNPTTGAFVIKKTAISTNASGVVAFSDGAVVTGTSYRVVWRMTADGAEGLETLTAT